MQKNVIQYHTEFHLLMAASSLKDIDEIKLTTIIGPKSELSDTLKSLGATHIEKDCRSDPQKTLPPIIPKKNGITIYTSFLIPFTAINYLKREGLNAGKVVRTDEGLGSFSNFTHMYSSALYFSKTKQHPLKAAIYAAAHIAIDKATRITPAFKTDFIFTKNKLINKEKQKKATEILRAKTQDNTINGSCVYVSQPMLFNNFDTPKLYAEFIKETSKKVSPSKSLVVKKHRDDDFDYEAHGLKTLTGKSLEHYSLEKSTVFGVGSTALITAKILCNCSEVYYVPLTIGYDGLSAACKEIFQKNLTLIEQNKNQKN